MRRIDTPKTAGTHYEPAQGTSFATSIVSGVVSLAAVRLAETWTCQGTKANESSFSGTAGGGAFVVHCPQRGWDTFASAILIVGMIALNINVSALAAEFAQLQSSGPRSSPSSNSSGVVQEMKVMIKKPAIARELLENIKWGMEQNVFLREDFYSEENIRKVLGDYAFRWEANKPNVKYLTIEKSAQSLSKSNSNHSCILGAVWSWGIKSIAGSAPLAKLQIGIALNHDDPSCVSLSADLIQDLFGKPTKVENIYPIGRPPPHGRILVPGPSVHRLGNTDIEYVLGDSAVSKRITFEIRGNGVATRFNLFMEQN